MIRTRARIAIAAGSAVTALLTAAAPAAATPLFASPTGDDMGGTNPCTNSNAPCTIDRAVEVVAVAGDDVTLAPGTYNLTDKLLIQYTNPVITVHGSPGMRPTIVGAAVPGAVEVGGTLRDVNVEDGGGVLGSLVLLGGEPGLLERVFVHASSMERACDNAGTIQDSVCWTEANTGLGVRTPAGAGGVVLGRLRNVTAIASGDASVGIIASANGAGARGEVSGTSVIAQGELADAQAVNSGGIGANIALSYSNYDTRDESMGGTVTDPTTMNNQTTPPVFVDAASGDFRQAASSAGTIDLGFGGPGIPPLGTFDLDGDPRTLGAAPDIGADEFVPPLPPASTVTPVVNPVVQPALKCKKKKRKRKKGTKRKKRRCRR